MILTRKRLLVIFFSHAFCEFASINFKPWIWVATSHQYRISVLVPQTSDLRPVVAFQNFSCYLRLNQKKLAPPVYSSVSSFSGHHVLLKKPTYPHPPGTCSLNFKHKPIYTAAWCTSMLLYL